jgi:hypothetical protein
MFNNGSVGVVHTRSKMPEKISEMSRLLPSMLALIYNCFQVIKITADHIDIYLVLWHLTCLTAAALANISHLPFAH